MEQMLLSPEQHLFNTHHCRTCQSHPSASTCNCLRALSWPTSGVCQKGCDVNALERTVADHRWGPLHSGQTTLRNVLHCLSDILSSIEPQLMLWFGCHLFPPKLTVVWLLMLWCWGAGPSGRCLGHEGGALMKGFMHFLRK